MISLSWDRIDSCSAVIYEQNRPTHQHDLQREFTNSQGADVPRRGANSRMVGYTETGKLRATAPRSCETIGLLIKLRHPNTSLFLPPERIGCRTLNP